MVAFSALGAAGGGPTVGVGVGVTVAVGVDVAVGVAVAVAVTVSEWLACTDLAQAVMA